MHSRAFALTLSLALCLSCAGPDIDDPASTGTPLAEGEREGPTRLAQEGQQPAPAPAPRRIEGARLEVSPIEAEQGEDGRGSLVPAVRPVALDLRSEEGWPGRALDPVLHVGQLRLTHYQHPAPDVLRFVVADGALLPAGAEVFLQYGDDVASRVVLTDSLEIGP